MEFKLTFYIPSGSAEIEVREVEKLLDKVKSFYNIKITKQFINSPEEEQIKSQFLWRLSVVKRIGIKQTRRTKSLYPQLVIFEGGNPITFYPQSSGKNKIEIKEFLQALLGGKILCFHKVPELEEMVKKNIKKSFN